MTRRTRGRRAPCEGCIFNLTDGIFKTSFSLFFPRILRLTHCGFQAKTNRFTAPQATIVAMTANAMRGDRKKRLQAGMDDYLTKQIERLALVAALEKWLKPKAEIDLPMGKR